DALTPAQKAQIPADVLKVLTSAEATYKTAEAEATKVEYFAKFSVKSVPIKKGQSSTALAKDIQIAKGDKVVKWTTSDKKVVTVNAKTGKIKGKKVGKATITATTQSGKTAKITVKVQKKAVAAKAVTLTNKATGKAIQAKKTVTLKKGKKLTVVANVKPMTCVQKVKFTSSNKKVVSVTSKGVIKAKKKGKATITAKVGKKTFKFTVKVK
ncbi:MAG: Ig-like domain-containing protein, partial [Lachnospiraceae bacterium]|nr:Ig-like domain-containing protein [Lachnospiraceae bacterium]